MNWLVRNNLVEKLIGFVLIHDLRKKCLKLEIEIENTIQDINNKYNEIEFIDEGEEEEEEEELNEGYEESQVEPAIQEPHVISVEERPQMAISKNPPLTNDVQPVHQNQASTFLR